MRTSSGSSRPAHYPSSSPRFECAVAMVQEFIAGPGPVDDDCADDLGLVTYPGVGRFPVTAADAAEATVGDGSDQSTATDRKVATVAAATVTDSIRRTFMQSRTGRGPALRGGRFEAKFGATTLKVDLTKASWTEDVDVTGKAGYGYFDEAIDAEIQIDGPGDSDGEITISGAWFAFRAVATEFEIAGTLGGRNLALVAPAT